MIPLPKKYGYKLPLSADNGTCVSITIEFPDILEYRAAFMGSINMLGKWFQWEHTQEDYQNIPELNKEVAQIWVNSLANASFEECMEFCARMILCMTTDEDVKEALRQFVINDTAINQHIANTSSVGVPLTTIQIEQPLTTVIGCDNDAIWAGIYAMINQMDSVNEDFLQIMEAYSNELEKASGLIKNVPLFGEVVSSITTNFVNSFIEDATENYEGVVTTALRQEYACDLFCMALESPDCWLTFEQVYEYFRARISGAFTIESAFQTVMDFIATGTYTGTAIVDFMFMMQIQTIRSASSFAGFDITNLGLTIEMGAENPSDAWETLCEECAPSDWIVNDFTTGNMHNWEAIASYAAFDDGWTDGAADDTQIGIRNPFAGITITALRVYMNVYTGPASGGDARWLGNADLSSLQAMPTVDGIMFESLELSRSSGIGINFSIAVGMTGKKIVAIWYKTT